MKKILFIPVLLLTASAAFCQGSFLLELSPLSFDEKGKIDPVFTSLLCSYNILNINDVFLTREIIDKGGYEKNPLMRWAAGNRPYELVFKSLLMLGENYTLKWLKNENELLGYTAAVLLNVLYGYVNYSNYGVMFTLNKEI